MKLPGFLQCCLPRRVSPDSDGDGEFEAKSPAPARRNIKFYYTNNDDSEETGWIFERYVPREMFEPWLAGITEQVMGRLGYLSGTPGIHAPDRREIHFYVEPEDGVAWTERDETGRIISTHVSSRYLRDVYNSRNGPIILKREITGVFHHEIGHAMQLDARGTAPGCLIEGIADFIRVSSGFAPVGWHVPDPSPKGTKWTEGSATWFLIYLDDRFPGFVVRLNQLMFRRFHEDNFFALTGRDADRLFEDFQDWLRERKRPGSG